MRNFHALILTVCCFTALNAGAHKPRLVIIFVVDQFPYYIIEKIRPHLRSGLKMLLERGISYTNCYHPHAAPATATGHATLSTGCLAKDHGVIGNSWFDLKGKKIISDHDTADQAAVFAPDGSLQPQGKSNRQLMVDTISDSLINQSTVHKRNRAYAISLKSRAAIMCAGLMGKPFWFDEKNGNFTTSKKYFKHMPRWILQFNQLQAIPHRKQFYWQPFFSDYVPYEHTNLKNYKHARASTYLEKLLTINYRAKKPFEDFSHTPWANKLVLDCAYACFKEKYKRTSSDDTFMLWISISSTDKIGHVFGPDSVEYTDMLYHLDAQIGEFITRIRQQVPANDILWVLTSDHGVEPIPEHSQKKGLRACRVFYRDIVKNLNKIIYKKFGFDNIILNFQEPQFYLNVSLMNKQPYHIQKSIIKLIKQEVERYPGVKRLWTMQELEYLSYDLPYLESYYKYQLYPGRSGQLILQVHPFSQFTTCSSGTAHRSPYNYNTHIPFILYQKHAYEKKAIADRVYSVQWAPTLAHILQIPRPSAATFSLFPGIISK